MKALILLFTSSLLAGQVDTPFQFSPLPGSPEFTALETQTQQELFQIPRELAQSMTSRALCQTCLNYPMRGDVFFFSTLDMGLATVKERFNGLDELLKRKDYAPYLVESLKKFDVDALLDKDAPGRPTYIDLSFICVLVSLENTLDQLDRPAMAELCTTLFKMAGQIEKVSGERGSASYPLNLACSLMINRQATVSVRGRVYDKTFLKDDMMENTNAPFGIEKAWEMARLCSSGSK